MSIPRVHACIRSEASARFVSRSANLSLWATMVSAKVSNLQEVLSSKQIVNDNVIIAHPIP